MNLFTSHSKDGRRANRRPSGWLGLLALGAILLATICYVAPGSRPAVPPMESPDQAMDGGDEMTTIHNSVLTTSASLSESLNSIESESNVDMQEELLARLVSSRALAETPASLQQLTGNTNRVALELSARWMRRWAESDPQAAAAFAAQLSEGVFRNALMEQAVLAWTESDWNTAAEWARGLSADREQMLKLVAEETIRLEPIESLRLATELSPGAERDELIVRASMEWAGQDAPAAKQWAQQIEDPTLRSQVLAAIAVAWADHDAPAAATLAVRDLPPGRVQEDAVVSILSRWIQLDADAATTWLNQFPAGQLKQAAHDGVMAAWSAHEPDRAREWLARTTSGTR